MDTQQPKTPAATRDDQQRLAPAGLLDGWTIETKWVGIGQCGAGQNRVLCRGNWGVIGGTGSFRILHPDGWVNDTPTFKTELEAMLWVMGKAKPSNVPDEPPATGGSRTPKIL